MRLESPGRGYALVAALIVLVIASLAVTLAVHRAQLDAQREREAQLLFVGDQYRSAIADYFAHPPLGQPGQYPQRLEDLLEDPRGIAIRRWLRQLYPDPMTGLPDWQLEKVGDRIVGVHSRSTSVPLRHAGFELADAAFAEAHAYRDWRFMATSVVAAAPAIALQTVAPGSSGNAGSTPSAGGVAPSTPVGRPGFLNPAKNCALQYGVPAAQCSRQPPPMGHDAASCQAAYQQLLDQCLASAAGG
jgi:type II secretory pathway pseudopilin PulG